MANLYVRSTDGNDADSGATWALAKATLAGAFAAASAGDTIWVSQNHAETQATAMTLTGPGTAASPCYVLCGNDAAEPPTSLATTATISTTVGSNMNFNGFNYYYGITFNVGSGNNSVNLLFGPANTAWWNKFDSCSLRIVSTHTGSLWSVGSNANTNEDDQYLELENTTLSFGNVSQSIARVGCPMRWRNTASALLGSIPTSLFTTLTGASGWVDVQNVDLSAAGSGKNLVSVGTGCFTWFRFENCKLGASVSITTGTVPGQGGARVDVVNCDSSDTNYRFQHTHYSGTVTPETTIVRTGGATNGTTAISHKYVTGANAKLICPLDGPPIVFWNNSTSSVTITVPVITDNVTLTDAEAWVEVEYLGTSGNPLGLLASDRVASVIATPANQTTDGSSTWTTTGLGTPVKQSLSTSFTAAKVGFCRVTVYLAKASTTMYVDPLVLTSSGRQWHAGPLHFINDPASSGATPRFGLAGAGPSFRGIGV